MINEQLLWDLLTPDKINPSEKGSHRGEVYGVILSTPIPLIKIGHGKSSIERVSTWLKTYPEEWTKDSMFIFHIKKTNRIETEKQIHRVLAGKKLGKNGIYELIKEHTTHDPEDFELDGRTEWFHVDGEVNDFFLKTFNVDITDWWLDHQESDSVTEEGDDSEPVKVEEPIDPEFSAYILTRAKELFSEIKDEWDEVCPYPNYEEYYRSGFYVYFDKRISSLVPQFKEEYEQLEYQEFFDKCNEYPELLIQKKEVSDNEGHQPELKKKGFFSGRTTSAVVVVAAVSPILYHIYKKHTPLETTGIVLTFVLMISMFCRSLSKN